MKSRLIIVEDEALIADHLAMLLEDLGHDIIGVYHDADELFEGLAQNKADLVLLDINLNAALDGVDIANQLNQVYHLPFVFISSNTDERTLKRVQHVNPSGFISKPFKVEQLKTTLHLALSEQKTQHSTAESDHFFIKDQHQHVRIDHDDVLYAKADDNYVQLLTRQKRYVLTMTLKQLEEKLPSSKFMRCHRSFLVHLAKIDRLGPNFLLIGEKEIPMSDSYKKVITDQLSFL